MDHPAHHLPKQLRIIHLSDLHFGSDHRYSYQPEKLDSEYKRNPTKPSLSNSLIKEIKPRTDLQTIVIVTGDLTQSGSDIEYYRVEAFFDDLIQGGVVKSKNDILVTPGNHDLTFVEKEVAKRWRAWAGFCNRYFGTAVPSLFSLDFADNVWDRSEDLGLVLASLNTSYDVVKGEESENKGKLDDIQIQTLTDRLESLPEENLNSSIKIAIVHHHPILIPSFVESDKGLDAIPQAEKLIIKLRKYGFQLILHGHKHHPSIFTHDTKSAFVKKKSYPIIVFAGGSAGSNTVYSPSVNCNTFNEIEVRWFPVEKIFKIQAETKKLVCHDDNKDDLLETERHWEVLDTFKRNYLPYSSPPSPTTINITKSQSAAQIREEIRKAKGFQPIFYVEPTISSDDLFVTRVWLRKLFTVEKEQEQQIKSVCWSTSDHEIMVTSEKTENQNFCVELPISQSQLFKAKVVFVDDSETDIVFNVPLPVLYSESNYYY